MRPSARLVQGRKFGAILVHSFLEIALDDTNLLLQAHHTAWPTAMLRGEFGKAGRHVQAGLSLYEYEQHRHHAFMYLGHDPSICSHGLGTVITWAQGFPEQARGHAEAALQLARRLDHGPSLANALWSIATAYAAWGDRQKAMASAEELLKLSEEHKLIQTQASALIIGGWALAASGQVKTGLEQQHGGLAIWHKIGMRVHLPVFHCLLAETYLRAEKYNQAGEHLTAALNVAQQTGEHWWQARVQRIRARLMLHTESRDKTPVAETFQTAIQIACTQGAKSLELYAACDLARFLAEQGERRKAHGLLVPVYNRFTEGFETADLKDAKALLDELA